MKVLNNEGEVEEFQPKRIRNKIKQETGLDDDTVRKVTTSVVNYIHKNYDEEISTSTIRSLINSSLVKRGLVEEEKKSRKLGMSVNDFEELIQKGCKDNANIQYSPELISKYAYDSIAKEYALLSMPDDCAEAHTEGYVHHHDLEFFNLRPNCYNMDMRFVGRNGLKIDGKGLMGAVAKPAKSLEVILNHLLQALMASATVFSGGLGLVNFNTLLAPYCRGRSYNDIKQAIQGFIFNCNMSLVCRGGQILFSSIALDLSCPPALKDEPAVTCGGIEQGVYGDYKEEADLIFRAVCEVSCEKDGQGAYFRFPNILFNIRDGDLDEYTGNCKVMHEYGANNPTWYYNNCKSIERTTMGCRTSLPQNYTGEYDKDCIATGNFMYTTINLPLLALESNDMDDFYKKLDYYCEIVYKTLHFRRNEVEKAVFDYHMSDFLLQKDKKTGRLFYDFDLATYTIGYCGLNECLIELTGKGVFENQDLGVEIIEFINKKKDEFHERDGWRWSVIGSPAESTAGRFAKINMEKYPNRAVVQGTPGHYYLTNSSHIPVGNDEATLIDHIRNADAFHKLSLGGNLLHLWIGEIWSDPVSIWHLNQRIMETDAIFWAYSKVFTYCQECGFTINDNLDVCPVCGSKNVRTYDRITGYYLPTATYNDAKQQEFKDRYRHKI